MDVYLSVLLFPVKVFKQEEVLDRACRNKETLLLNHWFVVVMGVGVNSVEASRVTLGRRQLWDSGSPYTL